MTEKQFSAVKLLNNILKYEADWREQVFLKNIIPSDDVSSYCELSMPATCNRCHCQRMQSARERGRERGRVDDEEDKEEKKAKDNFDSILRDWPAKQTATGHDVHFSLSLLLFCFSVLPSDFV